MGVWKISGFLYSCDNCSTQHRQENADGHYTNSTPPDWMSLRYYVGAGRDGMIEKLLCPRCNAEILKTLGELWKR